jgi:hypothetical protein
MAGTIRVTSSGSIKRPLEEVRQQFADMAYHAAPAGVHHGVRFTIVSQDERHCRYRQEVTLQHPSASRQVMARSYPRP